MAGFDGSAGIASNAISDGNTACTATKLFWATSLDCRDLAVLTPVVAQVSLGSCTASQFSVAGVGTLSLNFSFPLLGKVGASSNSLN